MHQAVTCKFQIAADSYVQDIVAGTRTISQPSANMEELIRRHKAELLKADLNEGLTRMRLKLGLLSQKEYLDKKEYLYSNYDKLGDSSEEVT